MNGWKTFPKSIIAASMRVTQNPILAARYRISVHVGRAGRKGFGPKGGGSLFRAYRYAKDHPGLAGKELKPGKTLEQTLGIEPGTPAAK